jgi:hypothetical protein
MIFKFCQTVLIIRDDELAKRDPEVNHYATTNFVCSFTMELQLTMAASATLL